MKNTKYLMILKTTIDYAFQFLHNKKIEFMIHINFLKIIPQKQHVVIKSKQYLFTVKCLILCREKYEQIANRIC